MTLNEAVSRACAEVGIKEPGKTVLGRWVKSDTLSGKNGRGDGRVMVNDTSVTAFNWQTGEKSTIGLSGHLNVKEQRALSAKSDRAKEKAAKDAARACAIAETLIGAARLSAHPYLIAKGFRDEEALVIGANVVRETAGAYLVPDRAAHAIVIPARRGGKITSVQLIWEDGTKKFLFGGETAGAAHRIATGTDTWLCEGYSTGLSIRAALRGLKVRATVLCCFSASNLVPVARQCRGRVFIAADNDKPMPQFGGLGTGEYYARQTDLPYGMPPSARSDFNDMHLNAGIYAVQRALTSVMAGRR